MTLGEHQLVGSGAHDDGVLAGNTIDLGVGKYVAQGGLNVVEVVLLPGVGEVEGLNGLLVELGALGAGVGCDKDGVLSDWAPEGVGEGADDAERVHEIDVVEIDLNALAGVVGVEEDIDTGGAADGLVDGFGVFTAHVQGKGLVGDGLEFGGGFGFFHGFGGRSGQAGFAADHGSWLIGAQRGDLLDGGLVAGVDFGSLHKVGERAGLVALFQLFAPGGDMAGGGGLAQPVVGGAHAQILGRLGVSLLVEAESCVEVIARLSLLTLDKERVGRIGAGAERLGAENQQGAEEQRECVPGELERKSEAVHETPMRRVER